MCYVSYGVSLGISPPPYDRSAIFETICIKQIMHISRSVVSKIITALGNYIKMQNTLGFQPRVFPV